MFDFNHKKAVQALNYFADSDGGTINKMKAIKLIWLSDRAHLRRFGRPIIMDQYFALPFGPIPSNTKDLAEINLFLSEDEVNYRNQYINVIDKYNFQSVNKVDEKIFSKTDLTMLKNVYSEFGDFSEFELSELSHTFPEWKKHEAGLINGTASRFQMNYLDFFEDSANDNCTIFKESKELKELAKDLYSENVALAYGTC
ncbi:MAG: SocA family protein [Bacteroidetes bacterium]|nr:SocA family protein [Bacteroidota bacterium]